MADSNITWESIGKYKVQIGLGGGFLAIIAVIPSWAIGVVVIMATGYFIYSKETCAQEISKFTKWLQTQLESETVTAELKSQYAEILGKLFIN